MPWHAMGFFVFIFTHEDMKEMVFLVNKTACSARKESGEDEANIKQQMKYCAHLSR